MGAEVESAKQELADFSPGMTKLGYVAKQVAKWTAIVGLGGAGLFTAGGSMLGAKAALGGLSYIPFLGTAAAGAAVFTETGRGLIGSALGTMFTAALPVTLAIGAAIGLVTGLMGMESYAQDKQEDLEAKVTQAKAREGRAVALQRQYEMQREASIRTAQAYGLNPNLGLPGGREPGFGRGAT